LELKTFNVSIFRRIKKEEINMRYLKKFNESWDNETWLLHNDGIDYKGEIKDIVDMVTNKTSPKKYSLVDIELSRIGESPIYDKDNIERAKKADYTEFPIIAVDLGINGIGVLDGNHRVFQAREDGKTELKGYLIPLKDIEKYIIKK
jgi:hypothetical protein